MAMIPEPDVPSIIAPVPAPKSKISWGGVIKGAAIITAAVVVGWAVFGWASTAIPAYLAPSSTAFGAETARAAVGLIGSGATWVWNTAAGIATFIGTHTGLSGIANTVTEAVSNGYHGAAASLSTHATTLASNTASGIAAAGAGLATLSATKAMVGAPHILVPDASHFSDPVTLAKAGHASTHGHSSWTERVSTARPAQASWAEYADASKPMGPNQK